MSSELTAARAARVVEIQSVRERLERGSHRTVEPKQPRPGCWKRSKQLREALAAIKDGKVEVGTRMVRQVVGGKKSRRARALLEYVQKMRAVLGRVVSPEDVIKWEIKENAKEKLHRLGGVAQRAADEVPAWLKEEDTLSMAGATALVPTVSRAQSAPSAPIAPTQQQPRSRHSSTATLPDQGRMATVVESFLSLDAFEVVPVARLSVLSIGSDNDESDDDLPSPVFSAGSLSPESTRAADDDARTGDEALGRRTKTSTRANCSLPNLVPLSWHASSTA